MERPVEKYGFSIQIGTRKGIINSIRWPYVSATGGIRFATMTKDSKDEIEVRYGEGETGKSIIQSGKNLVTHLNGLKAREIIGIEAERALSILRKNNVNCYFTPHVSQKSIEAYRNN